MGSLGKLAFAACGVYCCYLYYGSLQEDVFRYVAPDGSRFVFSWTLQVIEALAHLCVASIWLAATASFTTDMPHGHIAVCGLLNVTAKYCTSAALQYGLSFPTAVLAKSGKMVPVMIGTLVLGGRTFTLREYVQAGVIIGGTVAMSLARMQGRTSSGQGDTPLGALFIAAALVTDGVTGGFQQRMLMAAKAKGMAMKPYVLMFWTALYQAIGAFIIALLLGEFGPGIRFLTENSEIMGLVLRFGFCSAIGQSFVFYTLAEFDPVTLCFLTTTRKVLSVLLSIFTKGHHLSPMAWAGVLVVFAGIAGELHLRIAKAQKKNTKDEDQEQKEEEEGRAGRKTGGEEVEVAKVTADLQGKDCAWSGGYKGYSNGH